MFPLISNISRLNRKGPFVVLIVYNRLFVLIVFAYWGYKKQHLSTALLPVHLVRSDESRSF